ncbi:protein of unknown function (DUF4219) [Popillia japonica]|uniref:DUF4219 domain-containing protein n=1 Tax=Popillia japonica TaxID=7064 RepID=A0AAW1LCE8_POPJA
MANFLPSIEKLSGRENYNNWAFAMQAYLEHEDLWSCIVDIPDTPEQLKWDAKAKSKIIMMVHTANFVHITSGKTAKEVWEKLRETFQDYGLCRKVGLMRKLILTKLNDCSSMEEYVSTVVGTSQMLNA